MFKTYSSRINYKAAFGLTGPFAAYYYTVSYVWPETDTKFFIAGAGGPTSAKNIIQKITYGTETAASIAATLQGKRGYGGGTGGATNGFVIGGSNLAATDKTTYSNDTCAANT